MYLRINETLQTGAVKNRTYQVRGESVYLFLEFTIVLVCEIVGVYIMLLWDLYREERNRQRQEREAALQQARSRTEEANSRAEEAEKRIKLWEAWNARRVEAERRNTKFDEPPPSESDKYKLQAHVKRKCKARRETEFFRKNSVSLH